jgi:hypothetical protein
MTTNSTVHAPPIAVVAARLSAAAIIVYQLLLLLTIVIRPELDPAHRPVSEYAIGRHGWVMVLAFLTAAVSYACLLVAVRPVVRGRAGRAGLGVLGVCAVGTAGVGVFVADPVATPWTELTATGTVHVISGLSALVLLPFVALLLNSALTRGTAGPILRWTAWLPLAGLVLHVALSAVVPPEGWPPRFLFMTYAVWLLVLTAHLRRDRGLVYVRDGRMLGS